MYSFEDAMKSIFAVLSGWQGDKIAQEQIGNYFVSTVETAIHGWETAICKDNGRLVIAARYANKEEAEAGHKTWCSFVKINEPQYIFSPQTERIEAL